MDGRFRLPLDTLSNTDHTLDIRQAVTFSGAFLQSALEVCLVESFQRCLYLIRNIFVLFDKPSW